MNFYEILENNRKTFSKQFKKKKMLISGKNIREGLKIRGSPIRFPWGSPLELHDFFF